VYVQGGALVLRNRPSDANGPVGPADPGYGCSEGLRVTAMTESTPVIGGPHHGQLLPVEEWMRPGDCCAWHIEEKSRPMPRDIFEASRGAAAFRRFTYRLVQVGYGDAPAYQQILAWVPASVEQGQEMTHILDVAVTAPAAEYP